MVQAKRHWFKARDDGFGWSRPLTWQGWLVYMTMFGAIGYEFFAQPDIGGKLLGVWLPVLACIPICWLFGEPLSKGKPQKAAR